MPPHLAGELVVVRFPFSDLSGFKLRPAIVLGCASTDEYILCQVTSQPNPGAPSITLRSIDLADGYMRVDSFVRPSKLFTADNSIIQCTIGKLCEAKLAEIRTALYTALFSGFVNASS